MGRERQGEGDLGRVLAEIAQLERPRACAACARRRRLRSLAVVAGWVLFALAVQAALFRLALEAAGVLLTTPLLPEIGRG